MDVKAGGGGSDLNVWWTLNRAPAVNMLMAPRQAMQPEENFLTNENKHTNDIQQHVKLTITRPTAVVLQSFKRPNSNDSCISPTTVFIQLCYRKFTCFCFQWFIIKHRYSSCLATCKLKYEKCKPR